MCGHKALKMLMSLPPSLPELPSSLWYTLLPVDLELVNFQSLLLLHWYWLVCLCLSPSLFLWMLHFGQASPSSFLSPAWSFCRKKELQVVWGVKWRALLAWSQMNYSLLPLRGPQSSRRFSDEHVGQCVISVCSLGCLEGMDEIVLSLLQHHGTSVLNWRLQWRYWVTTVESAVSPPIPGYL